MKRRRPIGRSDADWPRGPYTWIEGRTLYISAPFTWNLPEIRAHLENANFLYSHAVVGGPAVELMPDFFADLPFVTVGHDCPGILQRVNPMATRTSTGCIRQCGFCGIGTGRIEPGGITELADWPDLPVVCDNNLLATSRPHFDRVIDRLVRWKCADFNQGLDARLLTEYHAQRFAEIRKPLIRLALDSLAYRESWERAYDLLRSAGVAKTHIRSFVLIGFNTGPDEAWERYRWVNQRCKALPMWFHRLDALEWNTVTADQVALGWDDEKRMDIMKYFYQHSIRANRHELRRKARGTVEMAI